MEYLKLVKNNDDETNTVYTIVDVYNKHKYYVSDYLNFLISLHTLPNHHLAEVPLFPSPILVDVDFKKEEKNIQALYDESVVKQILQDYIKILDDYLETKINIYQVILFEKPPRKEDQFIKHGFHLQFLNISLNKSDLKFVTNEVKKFSPYSVNIDDVSSKMWLLYGGSKCPESLSYNISKTYFATINSDAVIFEEKNNLSWLYGSKYLNIEINSKNINNMLPAILSIRNIKTFSLQLPNKLINLPVQDTANTVTISPVHYYSLDDDKIAELVLSLSIERADNYNDWITVCIILTNIAKRVDSKPQDFYKGLFLTFSEKSSKFSEIESESKWMSFMRSTTKGILGVGSLIRMAQEDGIFDDFSKFLYNFSSEYIPVFDYSTAKMIKETITDKYMTSSTYGCFRFEGTIWQRIDDWSDEFKGIIMNWGSTYLKSMSDLELDEIQEKTLSGLRKKLNSYTGVNAIKNCLFDLYYSKHVKNIFEQNGKYIAFNNCVFNIDDWRLEEPDPDFYLVHKINHDLILWDDVDEEDKKFVLGFFEKTFPDAELRNYFVESLARFMTGRNVLKQFFFLVGNGDNGKSMFIRLMENVFGKQSMKGPKTLVTIAKKSDGAASPELFRLKDARMVILDELTENDLLDPGKIKYLTGTDTFYGRDLYQKGSDVKEITPMFFPILITNEIPIISKPDEVTWNRIRLINFESKFVAEEDVDSYKLKFPELADKVQIKDVTLDLKLKVKAKYFLSYFVYLLLTKKSLKEYIGKSEKKPQKAVEGLLNFRSNQNVIVNFMSQTFRIDPNSPEMYSIQKITNDYNQSKLKKVTLDINRLTEYLEMYIKNCPGVTLSSDGIIRGLSRVTF